MEQNSTESPGIIEISEQFNKLLLDSTDNDKAQFLQVLHERGETPEEVVSLASILRSNATLSPVPDTSDIVGTGGDGMNTINVSTAASFVLSSMGIRIAKHGNFGATSNKGSADFLKYLGYNFEMDQEELESRLRELSFAFVLAPMYNSNFAKFAKARKMLPHKTVFNYLGPLTNPVDPKNMMLGVADEKISGIYSSYLILNNKSGCVVYSDDGMDEISPNAACNILMVKNGKIERIHSTPETLTGRKIMIDEVSRTDPIESFELTRNGLTGKNEAVASFISLNASMSLIVNNRFDSLEEAYAESMKLIKSGFVKEHIDRIFSEGEGN